MERFILDTSLFTNPDVYAQFGAGSQEAIRNFLEIAARVQGEFYMPGSVYEELRLIKDLTELAADFESVVKIRSPRKFSLMIPSEFLYEFIDEVRHRIGRGLRIAEELAKMAGQQAEGADTGKLITKLRERYREAMRRGILDSKEDVDVLLLAYELDGVLVSGDEGLRKSADKVGIKIIDPRHLRKILLNLIKYQAPLQ
jgi:uncharacterized protein